MTSRSLVFPTIALLAVLTSRAMAADTVVPAETAEPVSFIDDIKPVLTEKCAHCHNRKTLPERVSFETRKRAFAPDARGKVAIVPREPDASLIVRVLEQPELHEGAMPQTGPRPTPEDIAKIRQWVAEGADWPTGKDGRIRPTFYAKE